MKHANCNRDKEEEIEEVDESEVGKPKFERHGFWWYFSWLGVLIILLTASYVFKRYEISTVTTFDQEYYVIKDTQKQMNEKELLEMWERERQSQKIKEWNAWKEKNDVR